MSTTQIKGYWLQFNYSGEQIRFIRIPRTEDTTRILIKVHPDCQVEVAAPSYANDEEVITAVKKRGRWIYQKLCNFQKQLEYITPRKYVSGESHYYLGKQYLLKVIEAPNQAQGVKLHGKLEVFIHEKNTEKVRHLLTEWYKTRAKEIFTKRLDVMLEQTLWVQERPPLRILTMKTQWGSCSPSGRLTLNPHLAKAPRECIDYVILHELCHIAEHNHSKRFYRLITQVMPKWEQIKTRLDNMANLLLRD
jgi:predicted metal-dependent hydrolase